MTPDLFTLETTREPESAVAARDRILKKLEKDIGKVEMQKLREFVLDQLRAGSTSGEWLTDLARMSNLLHGDTRRMGAVLGALSREGLIEKCGNVPRLKGHGTSGGNLWKLKP
jgi:hypothetical protein